MHVTQKVYDGFWIMPCIVKSRMRQIHANGSGRFLEALPGQVKSADWPVTR